MPRCEYCDNEIHWAKKPGSHKMHPPLEKIGSVLVVTRRGEVASTPAYKRHRCDPADEAAFTHQKELEKEQRLDYQSMKEDAWDYAFQRDCPKCGEPAGFPCHNLTEFRNGRKVETVWPHEERMPPREGADV